MDLCWTFSTLWTVPFDLLRYPERSERFVQHPLVGSLARLKTKTDACATCHRTTSRHTPPSKHVLSSIASFAFPSTPANWCPRTLRPPFFRRGERVRPDGIKHELSERGERTWCEVHGGAGAMATLATQMQQLTLRKDAPRAVGSRVHLAGTRLGGVSAERRWRRRRGTRRRKGGGCGTWTDKVGTKPTWDDASVRAEEERSGCEGRRENRRR